MSDLRFDDKVVLITGAGRGLGAAYAKAFAERGASLVVNDPGSDMEGTETDKQPASIVVEDIIKAGGKAVANFDSVADERQVKAIISQTLESFGRIDIVINNAGNFVTRQPFIHTSNDRFNKMWYVHVLGSVNVCRAVWPHFCQRGQGKIINISSHAGYLGTTNYVEYAVVKSAIHGLTRTLALEGADNGIAVNAVAPGAMTRPIAMFSGIPEGSGDDAFSTDLVTPTVLWLCHDDCRVTGETYGVMSGTTTRIFVAETRGIRSRQPTPELIRDNFDKIRSEQAINQSGFVLCKDGEARGQELIAAYYLDE